MVMSDISQLSLEQARAERDAVLHAIGGDADGLRAELDAQGLTGWQWEMLAELEALEERIGA